MGRVRAAERPIARGFSGPNFEAASGPPGLVGAGRAVPGFCGNAPCRAGRREERPAWASPHALIDWRGTPEDRPGIWAGLPAQRRTILRSNEPIASPARADRRPTCPDRARTPGAGLPAPSARPPAPSDIATSTRRRIPLHHGVRWV